MKSLFSVNLESTACDLEIMDLKSGNRNLKEKLLSARALLRYPLYTLYFIISFIKTTNRNKQEESFFLRYDLYVFVQAHPKLVQTKIGTKNKFKAQIFKK